MLIAGVLSVPPSRLNRLAAVRVAPEDVATVPPGWMRTVAEFIERGPKLFQIEPAPVTVTELLGPMDPLVFSTLPPPVIDSVPLNELVVVPTVRLLLLIHLEFGPSTVTVP